MIDLVLLNYNDATTVIDFLKYVKSYESIDHIVVVDNASTDNSFQLLQEYCSDKIRLIRASQNGGYAAGNNYGIKYALENFDSKYVIISNPDVVFDEDVICILKQKLENPLIAAATGKMICTSSIKLPVAWKLPNYFECLLENLIILKKIFGKSKSYNFDSIHSNDVLVEAIPGSFFMLDVNKMRKVGFFDENTFLYYEENIIGFKLKKIGYKQLLTFDCSYIHNHSVSINKSIKSEAKRLKLAFDSRKYYCINYLNINKFEKLLLSMTFYVGRIDFIVAKSIKNLLFSK